MVDPSLPVPELVRRACEQRSALHDDPDQTAYRLFHGYGEGCAGLTIDRYGDHAVVAYKTDVSDILEPVTEIVSEVAPFVSVIGKAHRYFNWHAEALSVEALRGTLPTAPIEVRDNGVRLYATPHHGEANGLFLDTRLVRGWLKENSRDRRILNLFAYTGSLGVAAAAGGARSVVHVDSKKTPLQLARENHRLNEFRADDRDFMRGDVYQHLPKAARAGVSFEGIVLDPPPRVPDRKKRRKPVGQDYAKLVKLTVPLLEPGGWLLCFFHRFDQTRASFETEVLEHAGVPLEITWRGSSGDDFPEDNPERKLRVTAFTRAVG